MNLVLQHINVIGPVALGLIFFYGINAFIADPMQTPSVVSYVGFHGSGKTLHLVQEALKAFRDPLCLGIWSPITITADESTNQHKYHFLDTATWRATILSIKVPKEQVRKGYYYLWLLDEASLYLPSRAYDKLPAEFWSVIALARKSGWKIRWATQAEARVDLMIREVTMWVYECQRFAPIAGNVWAFTAVRRHSSEAGQKAKVDRSISGREYIMRWQCPRLFKAYDTLEAVEIAEHLLTEPTATPRKPGRVAT